MHFNGSALTLPFSSTDYIASDYGVVVEIYVEIYVETELKGRDCIQIRDAPWVVTC